MIVVVVVVVTFHIGIVRANSSRRTSKDGELGGLDTGNKTKSDREIEDDVAVTREKNGGQRSSSGNSRGIRFSSVLFANSSL